MIIMSVDLGKARTGIAICDKTEFLASPYTVIFEKSPAKLLEKVVQAAIDTKAERIVVGLPKNMDGSEGESAQNARAFAQNLAEQTGIETVMQDERGTTVTAHIFLNATNTRGKKRKNVVDEVAATIILQDYLDSRKRKEN
ncbi:MAG: Holliday junction resolvase RuvX [Ruminococcus sp.]|nr:Holliday junction resolvase RuvX [Ruminococcus sp.]